MKVKKQKKNTLNLVYEPVMDDDLLSVFFLPIVFILL